MKTPDFDLSLRESGSDLPFVSIIVPVKAPGPYLEECIEHCLQLDYANLEILVLPDAPFECQDPRVKVIPTGSMPPGHKRDKALAATRGEILAFIDDDAYPERDYLRNAIKYFRQPEVAAVAGPAVTPSSDTPFQQASGLVYTSFLGGGNYAFRYTPKPHREVDDYPSCNLLVRRSVLDQLGGFCSEFWPGEDTKLCLGITHSLKKKIIYAPDVVVYHHRRPLWMPHLKQVMSYATHRGYFVKRFPQTSFRPTYFLPSVFVAGLILGPLAGLIRPSFWAAYLGVVGVYLLLALANGMVSGRRSLFLPVTLGIILSNLVYGIWFIRGLLSRQLAEERLQREAPVAEKQVWTKEGTRS